MQLWGPREMRIGIGDAVYVAGMDNHHLLRLNLTVINKVTIDTGKRFHRMAVSRCRLYIIK